MLELVATLPAAAPLLGALADAPGAYLVGGAVRDLLLGGRPVDLDLVVEGDAAIAASRIGDDLVVHDRFGTSTVTAGGFPYDGARARPARDPSPGAPPGGEPAGHAGAPRRGRAPVHAAPGALCRRRP